MNWFDRLYYWAFPERLYKLRLRSYQQCIDDLNTSGSVEEEKVISQALACKCKIYPPDGWYPGANIAYETSIGKNSTPWS